MANSNQTSFQQEFNRLSFLASIATGASPANKTSFQSSSDDISRVINSSIGNKSIEANSTSSSSFLTDSSTNDLCASDIGRINSLLINANEQADLLKTQANVLRQPPTILRNRGNHSAKNSVNNSRMLSPLLPATNGTLQNLHLKKASQVVSNISSLNQQSAMQSTSSSSPKVLNQISSAKTNFGQTVILPANLAGVSGKVLIVNNPNKPPQTVTQKLNSQEVIQNNIQHKPVILIPSSTNDQQHTQQVQSNCLPLVVNSNLLKNNQLPALQHIQPISMNSFQSIRPKSFVQSIRPKMEIVNSTSSANSQAIRLSHFPVSSSVTINPSSVVVCNSLQNTLLEASSNSSLKTFTVSVLPSAFDKAMSEHLQTLEKIEPHLFTLNKGLLTNQGSSRINEDQVKQHIVQSTNQLHVVTSTIQSLQNATSKEHIQISQSALQQSRNTNAMVSPVKQSSNTVLKQNENLQNVIRQQQLKQLQEQHTAIIKNQVQQQALEQAKQQQNELFVLQQQLIQQVENQKHIQQKRLVANTINQPGVQAKLQIQPQNINLLQASQQNAPLKLLSSLTNMVNKSVAPSTATNGRLLTNSSSDQFFLINPSVSMQNIRPVLVQLPGGNTVLSTQLVNASQLSSAQLAELQKSLLMQQSKIIQPIVSQQQNVITSISNNQNNSIKSNSVLNFNLVSSASIFTPQTVLVSSSKTLAGQNIIQKSVLAPTSISSVNFNDKTDISSLFNKQLSNLSSIQKDQLLKQLGMAGLGNAQLQKTSLSSTMLISSILKNSTTGTAQEEQKQLLAQQVKKTNTVANKIRSVKRSAPLEQEQEHRLTKKWKHVLSEDQTRIVSPDIKLPFKSLNDVVTRLLPYHVFSSNDENSKKDSLKFDILFECYARNVLERKTWLLNKFNRIMFDEDLIISPSEEAIQIARLFNTNEIENFTKEKNALQEGQSTIVLRENGSLHCVAVEEQSTLIELQNKKNFNKVIPILQSSEQQPFEERLRVAHKDISRINFEESDGTDEEDELEEQDDEEEEIQIREFDCYKDGTFKMDDIELTAATDNLLADLQQQDDYNMRFEL